MFLTGWCLLIARRPGRRLTVPDVPLPTVPDVPVLAAADVPADAAEPVTEIFRPTLHNLRDIGDTLELPRISA